MQFLVELDGFLELAVAAQPRPRGAANDSEKPGAGVPAAKAGKELEGAEGGFLGDILGIALISGEPAREIVGGVEVRQDDKFELALSGAIQEVRKIAMK